MHITSIFWKFASVVGATDKTLKELCKIYKQSTHLQEEYKHVLSPEIQWYFGNAEYNTHIKILSKYLFYIREECFKSDKQVQICIEKDLILSMVQALPCLPLEERKEVVKILQRCLLYEKAFDRILEYNEDVGQMLLSYFTNEELVGLASSLLQRLLQDDKILQKFCSKWENIQKLLQNMNDTDFDLIMNSSTILSFILTTSSCIIDEFFEAHFEDLFDNMMQSIVQTEHILIRCLYLKIIYKILTCRRNIRVLIRFVSKDQYLRVIMNCLLEKSFNVHSSAMEVFSLFMLCPQKSEAVASILNRNKDRLLVHFSNKGQCNDSSNDLRLRMLKEIDAM